MYLTSEAWKQKIYNPDTEHTLKIYVDNIELDSDYILGCNITHRLFIDDILSLGSTAAKQVDIKLYKDALSTLEITNIKIEYGIKIDNEFEMIPMGNFKLENLEEIDDNTINIKAVDYMMNFEFNYDGSQITLPATLKEVLEDICMKAGVELGTTTFINESKEINVYDNTVTARTYLKDIAESADCFAFIGRDNKLYLRKFYQDQAELDIELLGDFNWGAECTISNATYQDAIRNFTFGDSTGNVLWINPDNYYIVDEEQIENIFNDIVGFNTNSFTGTSIIDPALDLGDCLIIDSKKVLFQYSMEYIGRFKASIDSKIQSIQKESTVVVIGDPKIRKLQTQVNQITGDISLVASEQSSQSSKIANIEINVDGITTKVQKNITDIQGVQTNLSETVQDVNQIKEVVKIIGGANVVVNSMCLYGLDKHTTSGTGFTLVGKIDDLVTKTKSSAMIKCVNKIIEHEPINTIAGQTYTITLKYSNDAGNNYKFILTNTSDITLVETNSAVDLSEITYTFVASGQVKYREECSYIDNTKGGFYTDLIISDGYLRKNWEPAQGEIIGTSLTIYYNGVEITSPNSSIKTIISNLGFTVTDINDSNNIILALNNLRVLLTNTKVDGTFEIEDFMFQQLEISGDDCLFIL